MQVPIFGYTRWWAAPPGVDEPPEFIFRAAQTFPHSVKKNFWTPVKLFPPLRQKSTMVIKVDNTTPATPQTWSLTWYRMLITSLFEKVWILPKNH